MTINDQNLTKSQEIDFRDKAFYLLKKYTSYTCGKKRIKERIKGV